MRDAIAALSLGISLEEFSHLEEEHHEDSFWEFRFRTRKEADAKGTDGSYRHQEMLVKHIALGDAFCRLAQGLMSY